MPVLRILRRSLFIALLGMFMLLSTTPPAQAVPVPSSSGISNQTREQDLQRIEEQLNDPLVLEALERAGTDAMELRGALPRMSDHDIHQLAEKMDDVKTGGIGVIEILLIVILVIVIIYLVR